MFKWGFDKVYIDVHFLKCFFCDLFPPFFGGGGGNLFITMV